jgi:hypothetical protein
MQFVELLDKGTELVGGSKSELGRQIGMKDDGNMRAAWRGRPIPDSGLAKLAKLTGLDFGLVVAMHNAWTAKTSEEKKFWEELSAEQEKKVGGEGGIRTHGTFQYA